MSYADILAPNTNKQVTPQTQPIPGRESEMTKNYAGGFTFQLDVWGYLDRFLILGSDKPSYYAGAKELTLKAAENVLACIKADGVKTVARIVEISEQGRAPKNDPAIFALALCAINGNADTIAAAYAALQKVCRTGTHLFQFVDTIDKMGKWNAAAKRGIANWYLNRREDKLAVQMLKYQSRNGWAHRDVLRLAHIKPKSDLQNSMFRYAVKGAEGITEGTQVPQLLVDFETLKRAGADSKLAIQLIESNKDLSWEMLPTELQRDVKVWEALVPTMGITALIRKLGQLTNVGLIAPLSQGSKEVISKLTDVEAIKRGRVHPITLLNAFNQYKQGRGDKGSLTWNPDPRVLDALNDAFYESFNYVESTGQGHLIGVDCSGSMFGARVNGTNLTAAEVAGVMALAVAKREPNYWIGGFNTKMGELKITPNMRLDAVLNVIQRFNWGGTDCSLPMLHAMEHKMSGVDKFVVITDNETYAGRMQPVQALRKYREQYNRNSKLIVCGTSVTNFTIADPKDPGMLDIVGFDSSAPQLIQTF